MIRSIYASTARAALSAVLVFVVAGLSSCLGQGEKGGAPASQPTTSQASSSAATPAPNPAVASETKSLLPLQDSFRAIAKEVLPTVVEINVTELIKRQVPQFDFPFALPPGFAPFFGQGSQQQTYQQAALGSGIIVRHTGNRYYVLTNNHVVHNATDISVRLNDQKVFKATVVGTDPLKDIALVSFESSDSFPVAVLGDSNTLEVGDIVLAVGNPLGFESTLTMGVVSALGRHSPPGGGEVATYTDYIQTDAAINPGNSGGALVNIAGQVVGINTWIAAPSGGNIGLGFAIPINNAKRDIEDFITKGKVQYGWLGVQIGDVQSDSSFPGLAKDLKIAGTNGAFVFDVFKGSPADRAGLLPGDYITRVDNTEIQNASQLTTVVGNLEAGKSYDFALIRYGEHKTLSVRVGVRGDMNTIALDKNLWPGMTVVDLTDQIRRQANVPQGVNGVVVGNLESRSAPTAIAGLQPGDVVTAINGTPVRNLLDYYEALNKTSNSPVTFSINRQGTNVSIGVSR